MLDVAQRQSQDLDLGQLLVWGHGWQQAPERAEGVVEGLDPEPFAGGVSRAVLEAGAPLAALLLTGQLALGCEAGGLGGLGDLLGLLTTVTI